MIRRPKFKVSASINYSPANIINFNAEIIHVGQREDLNFSVFPAQQVRLESYTTVNISAVYNIISNIQLYGRVENLFDTEYEEVLGYNTPGLSGYAGVKFSL